MTMTLMMTHPVEDVFGELRPVLHPRSHLHIGRTYCSAVLRPKKKKKKKKGHRRRRRTRGGGGGSGGGGKTRKDKERQGKTRTPPRHQHDYLGGGELAIDRYRRRGVLLVRQDQHPRRAASPHRKGVVFKKPSLSKPTGQQLEIL